MSKMDDKTIQQHSLIAFQKWKSLWVGNCERNKPLIQTSQKDILGCFKDKIAYCFAYGPSFKRNIAEFKALNLDRSKIVVGCVDKAYRPLVEAGIIPDYCLVADGMVDVSWVEGVDTAAIKQTILICNVYGSPQWPELWAKHAGCKRIYWYLNKDNIECTKNNKYGTAEFFAPLVNYYEMIEAASNVGNSLVVYTVKIFGCKTTNLFAYDYSWGSDSYYGACDENKFKWMPHLRKPDKHNKLTYCTTNMEFSAQWLDTYIPYAASMYQVDIHNITGDGILKNGRARVCSST